MSPMRKLARTVAHAKSYVESHTTDMFGYFFSKEWREKGHYANLNKYGMKGPTKKGHKPLCVSGK